MTKLKYCTECKYSQPEINSTWNLRCMHSAVNAKDSWALSSKFINGTGCREERELTWWYFPSCGKAGKLWEIRLDSDPKL